MKGSASEGFVYVIHAVGTNRIKVGHTLTPEARLKDLQTGSPFPLRMLACWPGSVTIERRIHTALAEFRQAGEWFAPPPFIAHRILVAVKKQDQLITPIVAAARSKDPSNKLPQQQQSVNDWLKSILPLLNPGAWWEFRTPKQSHVVRLRWRVGRKKVPYSFSQFGKWEIEALKQKPPELQQRMIVDRFLRQLYREGRKDIAKRFALELARSNNKSERL